MLSAMHTHTHTNCARRGQHIKRQRRRRGPRHINSTIAYTYIYKYIVAKSHCFEGVSHEKTVRVAERKCAYSLPTRFLFFRRNAGDIESRSQGKNHAGQIPHAGALCIHVPYIFDYLWMYQHSQSPFCRCTLQCNVVVSISYAAANNGILGEVKCLCRASNRWLYILRVRSKQLEWIKLNWKE